jgi:hypothetical protein
VGEPNCRSLDGDADYVWIAETGSLYGYEVGAWGDEDVEIHDWDYSLVGGGDGVLYGSYDGYDVDACNTTTGAKIRTVLDTGTNPDFWNIFETYDIGGDGDVVLVLGDWADNWPDLTTELRVYNADDGSLIRSLEWGDDISWSYVPTGPMGGGADYFYIEVSGPQGNKYIECRDTTDGSLVDRHQLGGVKRVDGIGGK